MSQNLTEASYQWANRPADERFSTLNDLYINCFTAANNATTSDVKLEQVEVIDENGDLQLATPTGKLKFNNWSFSQFSARLGAPASYLTTLPSKMAAEALNYGLSKNKDLDSQIYFDNTTSVARAITSQSYARILNYDVVKAIMDLPGKWVVPPARPALPGQPGSRIATEADCVGSNHPSLAIKPGDLIAPAGLYGSDRDMFAFLVDPETQIDDGSDGGLSRGFFVRNSEVGNATFELVTFLYRYICGNHIVWGAEKVTRVSIKHIGKMARERAFDKMRESLKLYREASSVKDAAVIKAARTMELGATYDELLENVFGKRGLLQKKQVKAAYDKANEFADTDGSPRSIWGFANGVTRLSQDSPYTDERTALDRASGKIMDLAMASVN